MSRKIKLTQIEADSLLHRLEFLADEDNIDELFDDPAESAEVAQRMVMQIHSRNFEINLSDPLVADVLIEAIEGATVQDIAIDEAYHRKTSKQQAAAVKRALRSAAEKIEAITGRNVAMP